MEPLGLRRETSTDSIYRFLCCCRRRHRRCSVFVEQQLMIQAQYSRVCHVYAFVQSERKSLSLFSNKYKYIYFDMSESFRLFFPSYCKCGNFYVGIQIAIAKERKNNNNEIITRGGFVHIQKDNKNETFALSKTHNFKLSKSIKLWCRVV